MSRSLDDVIRESDHWAEVAGRLELDLRDSEALPLADKAVRLTEEIWNARHRGVPFGEGQLAEVFAERLVTRARVRQRVGQAEQGSKDARRALDLLERHGDDRAVKFPLLVPSVRLLCGELAADVGDAAGARRYADLAIAAYERRHAVAGVSIAWAEGLARYAHVLEVLGDRDAALERRRQAVRHFRDAGTELVYGPPLRCAAENAYALAELLGPPNPTYAREVLLVLQDGVEGFYRMAVSTYPSAEVAVHFEQQMLAGQRLQALWAIEIGADDLARRLVVTYGSEHGFPEAVGWAIENPAALHPGTAPQALRPLVEAVAADPAQPS